MQSRCHVPVLLVALLPVSGILDIPAITGGVNEANINNRLQLQLPQQILKKLILM